MFRGILLTYLLFVSTFIVGQELSGVIFEKDTQTPLIGAHIYIINSLQGTVSDVDGKFLLSPPSTYGELLITYVGYKDNKIEFTPESKNLRISLTPLTNQLEEISVKSTEDKKWKRLYKKFEASFLGATDNAKHCAITNPWVVDVYKGENGEIIAKSIKPIEIINNALGYKLTFHLTDFTLKGDRLHYQGFVYFDELETNVQSNINRRNTFLGSKRHFLLALGKRELESEGFEVYEAEFSPEIGFSATIRRKEPKLLKGPNELLIPDYLKIVYTNSSPQRAYLANNQGQSSFAFQGPKADLVPKGNFQMSTQSTNNQVSYLYSRNSRLLFTKNGFIINTKYIIEYGYWSWLGVAEMLPYEYEYTVKTD